MAQGRRHLVLITTLIRLDHVARLRTSLRSPLSDGDGRVGVHVRAYIGAVYYLARSFIYFWYEVSLVGRQGLLKRLDLGFTLLDKL